jgi:hypothetical protein
MFKEKRPGVAILVPEKIDVKWKNGIRNIGHYIIIQVSIHQMM